MRITTQPNYTIERMSDSEDIHFSTTKTTWTFDELDELLHQLYFFMEDVAITKMEQLGRYDLITKIKEGKLHRETK
jgi:hypothetical protein